MVFCGNCGTPVAATSVAAKPVISAPPSVGAPHAGSVPPPSGSAYAAPPIVQGWPGLQNVPSQPMAATPARHGQLAEWGPRAGAYLLDSALIVVPMFILLLLGTVSVVFAVLGYLLSFAGGIWFAYQVGATGQSPGMRTVGLRCISTTTGGVVGGGKGILRMLCHALFGLLCGIGLVVDLLFPLWDSNKQTIADKMVSTVVVTAPKQKFKLAP
jgi:uncharacterized RDD family membrane protein YckC